MFDLEKEIAEWRREMLAAGIARHEILSELEGHLREEFQRETSSGVAAAEAFRNAAATLGEGKLLKTEFAKAGQRASWSLWSNPWTLKVVSGWFILAGLNAMSALHVYWRAPFQWRNLMGIGLMLVLCLQALIGIGLLRRLAFCRCVAVGWSRWALLLFGCALLYSYCYPPTGNAASPTSLGFSIMSGSAQGIRYQFLIFPLPVVFLQIISWLNIGMLVGAHYLLNWSRVRDLFGPQGYVSPFCKGGGRI